MKDWKFLFEKYILGKHSSIPEKHVKKFITQFTGDLFIDIGSNHRAYGDLLMPNFNKVITVDPNPKWKADLVIALSNYSGLGRFYIGDNNGSADSLLKNPHIQGKDWHQSEYFDVQVKRFDDLKLNADLVKIDVEGAERQVVEGMINYLPKNIIVEIHDERTEADLINLMRSKGYNKEKWLGLNHWWFGFKGQREMRERVLGKTSPCIAGEEDRRHVARSRRLWRSLGPL